MTSSYAWIVFRKVLSSVSLNIQIRSFLRLGSISSETSNAIRFRSKKVPLNVDIPRGSKFKDPYPFTSHGFTAGTNRRIGVPEFCTTSPIKIEVGSEIWKISHDGKQTLYAIMGKNGFKIVEK